MIHLSTAAAGAGPRSGYIYPGTGAALVPIGDKCIKSPGGYRTRTKIDLSCRRGLEVRSTRYMYRRSGWIQLQGPDRYSKGGRV